MVKTLSAGLVLACLVACGGERPSTRSATRHWSPAELVGCYEILDANRRRADSAWYNAMAVVRLTERPMLEVDGTVRPNTWHLRPLSNAGIGHWKSDPNGELETGTIFAPKWFLNPAGDSAVFGFGNGFSGAAITFAAADADRDTLRGWVTENWDFGPPYSYDRGRAYAVRRACT
jgi:hypothetical protein